MRIVKNAAISALNNECDRLRKHEVYRLRQRNTLKNMRLAAMDGNAAEAATEVMRAQAGAVEGIDQFCKSLLLADLKNITLVRSLPTTSLGVLDTSVAQEKIRQAKLQIKRHKAAMDAELKSAREREQSGKVGSNVSYGTMGGLSVYQIRDYYEKAIGYEEALISTNEDALAAADRYVRESRDLYGSVDTSVLSGLCDSVASLAQGAGLGSMAWVPKAVELKKPVVPDPGSFVGKAANGVADMQSKLRQALLDMDIVGDLAAQSREVPFSVSVGDAGEVVKGQVSVCALNVGEGNPHLVKGLGLFDADTGELSNLGEVLNTAIGGGSFTALKIDAEPKTGVGKDNASLKFCEGSLTNSVKWSGSSKTNDKGNKKKMGVTVKEEAKFTLVQGSNTYVGEIGDVPYTVSDKVNVGNVVVSGEASFLLLNEKGEPDPNLSVNVAASATLAEASRSVKVGTDVAGGEISAKGKLLTADAHAGVKLDKNGFKASAGAEAYLATGEIEGSLELLGVEVSVKNEFHAGGAGVKAEASMEGHTVEASLGAGLGVGDTLTVSVDFSDLAAAVEDEDSWLGQYVTYTRDTGSDYFIDMRDV